jgi:hypothetical protein
VWQGEAGANVPGESHVGRRKAALLFGVLQELLLSLGWALLALREEGSKEDSQGGRGEEAATNTRPSDRLQPRSSQSCLIGLILQSKTWQGTCRALPEGSGEESRTEASGTGSPVSRDKKLPGVGTLHVLTPLQPWQ